MRTARYPLAWLVVTLLLTACAPGRLPSAEVVQAAALSTEVDPQKAAPACPVTQPQTPAFTPPAPWPAAYPYEGQFWFGSAALWTELDADGTWTGLPLTPGSGLGQKLVWWREGYDHRTEQQPALTVTGRRLDGDPNAPAETATASRATNGYHEELHDFMLVGIDFPTEGCWEVTAEYGEDRLTYVVRISPE